MKIRQENPGLIQVEREYCELCMRTEVYLIVAGEIKSS